MFLNKYIIEEAALYRCAELGYEVGHKPQKAPGEETLEIRDDVRC